MYPKFRSFCIEHCDEMGWDKKFNQEGFIKNYWITLFKSIKQLCKIIT